MALVDPTRLIKAAVTMHAPLRFCVQDGFLPLMSDFGESVMMFKWKQILPVPRRTFGSNYNREEFRWLLFVTVLQQFLLRF